MDRTNGAGNVGRMFVAEDIATNRPPTEVTAAWLNAVQEEIAGTIEGSGAILNPASNAQLLAAIRALAQTQGDARYAALLNTLPTGAVFSFAGTSAPSGSLIIPVAASNVSRTTYAALFAAIGTTWGVGDGATTFGLPWIPGDYADVQAFGTGIATVTTGSVISHTHFMGGNYALTSQPGGANGLIVGGPAVYTGATGGSVNLAAGVRFMKCIKY